MVSQQHYTHVVYKLLIRSNKNLSYGAIDDDDLYFFLSEE